MLRRGRAEFGARLEAHQFVATFLRDHPSHPDDAGGRVADQAPYRIWVYWAQGFEQAPLIVSACRRRLFETNPDAEIVELDDQTIGDYVRIPEFITAKLTRNKTHYSDILRCALLAQYGGIWADATCYCASSLRGLFDRSCRGFFAYTRTDVFLLSSWFMISSPGHVIPTMLRDALFEFWRTADELPHYFWIHYIFEALYNQSPPFRAEWDARSRESSKVAHTLQLILPAPYVPARFREIMAMTPVQKLTYKIDQPGEGTYWQHVCAGADKPVTGVK